MDNDRGRARRPGECRNQQSEQVAAVGFGHSDVRERGAEAAGEHRRHGVFVTRKAAAVNAARAENEAVTLALNAIAYRQGFAFGDAVAEAFAVGGEGVAADVRAVSD